ncbi:Arsenate-mycothiol transferase ArsC1 [Agromyces sp. NDB4Y10]|uniref:metalloregulator ArsR/SmtB family transcription factor n=1 Tax=Agromyces sp. NDB4Y10 TaxID=1775951 RepID=UPI0007B192B7|nr:metalloregulator ArsR/SmtB family transcription factor [Agromyces sp. NDB4Y10]KZE93854.1 Arsenate-mycothiol transferase ArsC1 [Agromyces sp. NDB4Y10]
MVSGRADAAASGLALIADPTRARMLSLILARPDGRATVTELAAELGLRQPTVSHHAKALHDEGVLVRTPEGRRAWYSVAPDQAERVGDLLGAPASAPDPTTDAAVLDRIASDLADRFAGVFGRETVARYVRESHELLAERSGITRRLPSLTAQFAAERLSALATAEPQRPRADGGRAVPEVLFVCVQNAGRSQMAAAILRHLAGDRVHVRTAGSAPADALRPAVVSALDEIGVPVGGEFPKPLTDEVVRAADVVVTMGCGDACPIYPGRRYLDWELDDPLGLPLERVRDIRDRIEAHVRDLLASLDIA